MHNNPLHSNIMVEVDEFKFAKIIKSVIERTPPEVAVKAEILPRVNALSKKKASMSDSSCSLSDMDYDDETELSATEATNDVGETTALHPTSTSKDDQTGQSSSELSWSEVKELFAALDACNFETVGFREFCAHIFLLAALQDNQMLQCLYQHGVLLFDILGGGQNLITAERAKVFGRTMMGLSESTIDDTCEQMFDLQESSLVTFEEF